ncbi:MAG TPA: hypothetical protein VL463_24945 [Kofleriaceae bacterium]|nr:hypothetical protein [Kofleriaceae bacterium]
MAALCLVVHANACSFLFVKPAPPNVPPGAPVSCTDSRIFPWIDTLYGVAAVSSIVGGGASDTDSTNKAVGIPVMSVAAIGLLAGAYVGFSRVSRCEELEDAAAAAYHPYPQPYPYGYPPPQPQPYPYPYPPPQQPPQQPPPQQPQPPAQ